ncbi:MAG: hypothetical protein EXR71_15580 [Myxococcales bacterium]|nr:hypothetical protein [Myxococcales bacterium]
MLLGLMIACLPDHEPAPAARWPMPGTAVTVEINARLDGSGRATTWDAAAWADSAAPATGRGCRVVPTRNAGDLAAVDVTAPAGARLANQAGMLATAGPLSTHDARWQVGDAALLWQDGSRTRLDGAVRFGDGPELTGVHPDGDGGVVVSFTRRAEERVELDSINAAGAQVRCTGGTETLVVPWTALDPARPLATLRAVRESLVVAPNAARVRVVAAVELVVSLMEFRYSKRLGAPPPPGRPAWEPRRLIKVRPSRG